MANPIKGEVSFESSGKTYTFRLGINSQVMLEERLKMSVQKYIREHGDDLGAGDIRLLFYAGLHQHHHLSEEEAGNLIDEIGVARAAEIFLEAAQLAAPKTNGEDTSRPQVSAKERIGMDS